MLSKLRHIESESCLFLLLGLRHYFVFLFALALPKGTMIFHETLTITTTQRVAIHYGT